MIEKLKQDNLFNGILYGIVFFSFTYILISGLNYVWTNVMQKQNYFPEPKLELLAMFFTILLFRTMMIKYKRTETGKGILLVMMVSTIVYIFIKGIHL